MRNSKETSMEMAGFLLQIGAVKLNEANPFTWASGRKSPIYCDNRITLSHPSIRTFIRQHFTQMVEEKIGPVDAIAGVATGGIAQGVLVAQELGLPFVYVRPEPKSHGLANQIEGEILPGQSVIVVEDLISTGKSSLKVVDALKDAGCMVKAMIAIFTYNLEVAQKNFEEAKLPLYTLTNYNDLLECAIAGNYISRKDEASLIKWRNNPEEWSDIKMREGK